MVTRSGETTKSKLLGAGQWSDPESNCTGFTSALSGLHVGQGIEAAYKPMCPQCHQNWFRNPRVEGCDLHPAAHCVPKNFGNPTKSSYFKAQKKFVERNSNHVVRGAGQITIGQLRLVRNACVTAGSKFTLMIFIATSFGIDLFQRKTELQLVNAACFDKSRFLITKEYILDGICVLLKKKITDSQEDRAAVKRGVDISKRYAWIWGDPEDGELDLIRNLMAWIHLIQWKGGFLFPGKAELENPPSNGIYTTCISDDCLRESVEKIFEEHYWADHINCQTMGENN